MDTPSRLSKQGRVREQDRQYQVHAERLGVRIEWPKGDSGYDKYQTLTTNDQHLTSLVDPPESLGNGTSQSDGREEEKALGASEHCQVFPGEPSLCLCGAEVHGPGCPESPGWLSGQANHCVVARIRSTWVGRVEREHWCSGQPKLRV